MAISKISIENIRGFDKIDLEVNLRPNCANILVAPNGFGKSSISTAFSCAAGRELRVPEKDKHKKNDKNPSLLTIEYKGQKLKASASSNDISNKFDIHVIKSNIEPKAKLPKVNGFTVAKPYMEISPIDLGPKVEKEKLNFDLIKYQNLLSPNSKVAPNLPLKCDDKHFRSRLLIELPSIDKLKQKGVVDLFEEIIYEAKSVSGTKIHISSYLESRFGSRIEEIPHLKLIFDLVMANVNGGSWIDGVLICYMLMDACRTDRSNLKRWLQYGQYCAKLHALREFISDINGAWVAAEVKEIKGRVLVNFPDASSLSNGQRDLLYFGCCLLKARNATGVKPCLIVIDEVFDYLDDANIVVAQYFLSKLVDAYREEGGEVYICLLTHLDPSYFKGYALSRQQVVYLGDDEQKISNTMKKVILNRDDVKWSADISKYFLHYHPDEKDISGVFNEVFGLPKKHGSNYGFYEFLEGEWSKCVSSSGSYDPFAVCAYVRVQIERCAYEKIQTEHERHKFLDDCNGTSKKLEFVQSLDILVPEVCLLLGVVYNDALHRKGSIDQSSSIALKLKNLGLQNIMRQAVAW